jgi:predicted RNA binding protein YcfA (HicA-like mRNA interferase family)
VSPKLPQVSGDALVRLLIRLGYEVSHQRGSHVQLRKSFSSGEHRITVPAHKTLAKGTLSDILGSVSIRNGISKDELIARL